MNKKLLTKINRALENTKATCLAPVTKDALQKRLSEELDWADADPDRWACIEMLNDVMEKVLNIFHKMHCQNLIVQYIYFLH